MMFSLLPFVLLLKKEKILENRWYAINGLGHLSFGIDPSLVHALAGD